MEQAVQVDLVVVLGLVQLSRASGQVSMFIWTAVIQSGLSYYNFFPQEGSLKELSAVEYLSLLIVCLKDSLNRGHCLTRHGNGG